MSKNWDFVPLKNIVGKIERLAEKIEEVRSLRLQTIKETEILLKSFITKIFTELDAKQGCLSDILIDKPRNGWSVRCDNSHNGIPVLSLSAVTRFVYKKTEFKRTSGTLNFDAHLTNNLLLYIKNQVKSLKYR